MAENVELARHAGFCFGAARGYAAVEEALKENIPIYTFGPILNNDKIVEDFAAKGVKVINSVIEIKDLPKGKIIIRSHGVPRKTYEELLATGFEIFDATCPFVKRIHKIVEEKSTDGYKIVVVGNRLHPEVIGIVGWSLNGAFVVENEAEVRALSFRKDDKICVVSQTTFNRTKFQELVEIFDKLEYNVSCMNTICDATAVRQSEAMELSRKAEVMIVIGDSKSSNSRKLFDICSANCSKTYFIQTVDDIKSCHVKVSGLVGVTAGASTPNYIIEEVQSYVRNDF